MKKIAVIILILKSLFTFCQNSNSYRFPDLKNKIGTHFPLEIFKDGSGELYSQSYLKGKRTLVNFWSTTCAPCLEELPFLNDLEKTLGNKVNFVAITFDDEGKVRKFLLRKNFNFQHITNALPQLKSILPIIRNPMSFILDKNGDIIEIYGPVTSDNFKSIENTLRE